MSRVKICKNCIMPATFPNIRFDEKGICNFCLSYKKQSLSYHNKTKYEQKFHTLIDQYRGKYKYDGLMAYSGGKDSSFTLYLMVKHYNLRMLALTFNNGFIPEQTWANIQSVVDYLKIDHLVVKPDFMLLKRIFRTTSEQMIFPPVTLRLASSICTACMGIVKSASLRTAIEEQIPFIIYGWSPGQAPLNSSIMKNNWQMLKETQQAIYRPLQKIIGNKLDDYFLNDHHFQEMNRLVYNIHPLAFLDYNEDIIFKTIEEIGWKKPAGLDSNSTNCLLNSFANIVHKQQFGYHPYVFELANLVREGYLTRAEAYKRVHTPEDTKTVAYVRQILEL